MGAESVGAAIVEAGAAAVLASFIGWLCYGLAKWYFTREEHPTSDRSAAGVERALGRLEGRADGIDQNIGDLRDDIARNRQAAADEHAGTRREVAQLSVAVAQLQADFAQLRRWLEQHLGGKTLPRHIR